MHEKDVCEIQIKKLHCIVFIIGETFLVQIINMCMRFLNVQSEEKQDKFKMCPKQ